MFNPIRDLLEFSRAFSHHAPDRVTLDDYPFELRIKLLIEEAFEFVEACGYRVTVDRVDDGKVHVVATEAGHANMVEMVDALIDVLYVTFGALVAMGLSSTNVRDLWNEVQRSNMAKLWPDGTTKKNEYGKSLKPPGWTPPNLKDILGRIKK